MTLGGTVSGVIGLLVTISVEVAPIHMTGAAYAMISIAAHSRYIIC